MRININNPYGVYMHDTSEKGVFGDDNRFVSSGCIRVQNVRDYVQWLLKDTPGWDRGHIDEAIRSGARTDVRIASPVPVYWVYITAWASPNGLVQFREDIYQRDGFNPVATGSIGRPEPQDNVSPARYERENRTLDSDAGRSVGQTFARLQALSNVLDGRRSNAKTGVLAP